MALSNREKTIIGVFLIVGALGGLGFGVVLPAWQSIQENKLKLTQLEQEVQQLNARQGELAAEIQNYAKGQDLPQDLVIRQFKPDTLEKNLKEMLDQVIQLATGHGGRLISLQPVTGSQTPPPPPPPAPAASGATASSTASASGATPAAAPSAAATATPAVPPTGSTPPPGIQTFDYELAIRGSYSEITQFLSSLNQYKELIEITGIEMKNEGGAQRQGDVGSPGGANFSHLDPTRPIKLTTKLKLYLLPAIIQ